MGHRCHFTPKADERETDKKIEGAAEGQRMEESCTMYDPQFSALPRVYAVVQEFFRPQWTRV